MTPFGWRMAVLTLVLIAFIALPAVVMPASPLGRIVLFLTTFGIAVAVLIWTMRPLYK